MLQISLSTGTKYDIETDRGFNNLKSRINVFCRDKKAYKDEIRHVYKQLDKLKKAKNNPAINSKLRILIGKIPYDIITNSKQITVVQLDGKIIDERYFPRTEFFTRFKGTTAYEMNNFSYYGTYHRSEQTRFFDRCGGREKAQFSTTFLKKPDRANSFSAHVGGYHNPFNCEFYRDTVFMSKIAHLSEECTYDNLIRYKRDMCEHIFKKFDELYSAAYKTNKCKANNVLVYNNDYPCLIVKLEHKFTLEKFLKPLQSLLMSVFIAMLNNKVIKNGLYIEAVIRSSFGHNIPSVCETDKTFRINVGLIPAAYADIIAETLFEVNAIFKNMDLNQALIPRIKNSKYKDIDCYNAKKLKKLISEKPRFKKPIEGKSFFKNAEHNNNSLKLLIKSVQKINDEIGTRSGKIRFTAAGNYKDKNIWEIMMESGDTKGRTTLSECFRENKTKDWFASKLLEILISRIEPELAIQRTVSFLFDKLSFANEQVTMDYKSIDFDLEKYRNSINSTGNFTSIYKSDHRFSEIVAELFTAFNMKRPTHYLYSELEKASSLFSQKYRGSKTISAENDFGSDSEFSDLDEYDTYNFKTKIRKNESHKLYHSKIRVCSGMKAIVTAHFMALCYIKGSDVKNYSYDAKNMYYETEGAIKMVKKYVSLKLNKVRARENDNIIYHDLNHCNASGNDQVIDLNKRIESLKPSVVIVDFTSSTHEELDEKVRESLRHPFVNMVIAVNSGLKNCQGGSDKNPFGEIRVITKDKSLRAALINAAKKHLDVYDRLSQQAHEQVRALKNRGLGFSYKSFIEKKNLITIKKDRPSKQLRLRKPI